MAENTPSSLSFTDVESKLLISIIKSASRDVSNNIASMCDWSAIATELGYSTPKSARDQWNKLKAKKLLKPATDATATPASTKRKKDVKDGEEGSESPTTAKKTRKDKQDKKAKATTPVKEEEVEAGEEEQTV